MAVNFRVKCKTGACDLGKRCCGSGGADALTPTAGAACPEPSPALSLTRQPPRGLGPHAHTPRRHGLPRSEPAGQRPVLLPSKLKPPHSRGGAGNAHPVSWGRNENLFQPMVSLLGLVLVFKIKVIISIRISSKILDFCKLKGPITDKSVLLVKVTRGPRGGTSVPHGGLSGLLCRLTRVKQPRAKGHFSARCSEPAPVGGGRPRQCSFRGN